MDKGYFKSYICCLVKFTITSTGIKSLYSFLRFPLTNWRYLIRITNIWNIFGIAFHYLVVYWLKNILVLIVWDIWPLIIIENSPFKSIQFFFIIKIKGCNPIKTILMFLFLIRHFRLGFANTCRGQSLYK